MAACLIYLPASHRTDDEAIAALRTQDNCKSIDLSNITNVGLGDVSENIGVRVNPFRQEGTR